MNKKLPYKVLIGAVYLSGPQLLEIVDLQTTSEYEKRNFFRIKVYITTQAYPLENEAQAKTKLNPTVKPFDILIKNLSLSGLLLKTSKYLEEGGLILVNLKLYNNNITFVSKIVRKINPTLEDGNEYGCMFVENKGSQFDLLCKYIFDFQREQIRKMNLVNG